MTPTFRVVRQGEQADTRGPGSRPKHGDPVRVSTEGCNVLFHPAKSLNLIQQAVVPFSCLVTCTEESCGQTARQRCSYKQWNFIYKKKQKLSRKLGKQC